ncbi:MAG: DUF2608 domain-containing protein [Verrucomicrobia bacterium]|nr:DUF2608 domain-containing protein [Verrucomicrobiota bacterium]
MKLRSRILYFTFTIFSLCATLHASKLVTDTNDMAHALNYVAEGTLFVFDLDNTLIETSQHLGSDQWFTHRVQHFVDKGHSIDEALKLVVPNWLAIQSKTHMRIVDPSIPELLKKMHQSHVSMVALTKRPPVLAPRTLEQLAPLQIDFSKTSEIAGPIVFPELKDSLYRDGIIFVAPELEKGPVLSAFIKKMKTPPKKIVLIDDKMSHIQNVALAIESFHIPFVGIRYGGADEKVKSFDPKIADMQWEYFEKILTDEQAQQLLQLRKES